MCALDMIGDALHPPVDVLIEGAYSFRSIEKYILKGVGNFINQIESNKLSIPPIKL